MCAGDGGREAAWHLDYVEVACEGRQPTYFVCRKWLEAGCGYRAELAATSRNPRQEEAQYKVSMFIRKVHQLEGLV